MNKYLLPVFLLLLPFFSSAQLIARPAQPGRAVGFYEFLPEGYSATGTYKYPLIISFHGTGEKGNGTTDLDLVLLRSLGEMLQQQKATMKFTFGGKQTSFIVLLPQLSVDLPDWENFYVDSMINYAVRNLNVDVNKIFLTGYSLGGGAVWGYPATSVAHANKIAGIIPVSASPGYLDKDGYDKEICNIAAGRVATWAHHGINDDVIPVSFAEDGVNGVNNCQPDIMALSTIYPEGGHNQIWLRALDTQNTYNYPNVWEWMAGTTRLNTKASNQDPVANTGNDITLAFPATSTVLNGSASTDPNDVIVKYQWTKTAGPENYTIEKPNYPVTNLTNLQLGSYTFQLAVTDQFGVVRTDAVNVNVTSALPVTLKYLRGDLAGKFNNLTWATSNETNLDHFEILRSTDGIDFKTIGRLPAGRNTYAFTDDKAPAGTSYYRLKNVDKDGAFRYSDIIVITNNGPVLALSKYPNPVLDVLNVVVQGEVYGKIEISIINLEGRLVNKQTVNKQGLSWKGTVNTAHLQKGVYTIQVLQPGKMKEVSSFVKE